MCHEVQKQLTRKTVRIVRLSTNCAANGGQNVRQLSLFQSMPDAWGIDRFFPVLPLEGLDQVPERRAVLLDITCDSDGAISNHYVDGDGTTTMPTPNTSPENPPMLGFFMVGAHQEIRYMQ